VLGAGAGAGAAVAAVAVRAGLDLLRPSMARPRGRAARVRWGAYLVLGGVAAATVGPWVVVVLIGAGLLELGAGLDRSPRAWLAAPPAAVAAATGGLGALAWVAFKVGALSYGGGFVIVPLMQADAVDRYRWLSASQFLNAVALGQVTPGPVVHTVAVVGYGAAGLGGGLLASLVAFAPSFVFVLGGASRFGALRRSPAAQRFLAGAGPAAIGAILGSAVPLARALDEAWQYGLLAAAAVALLGARRHVVVVLLAAGAIGMVLALAGAPLPR
jgi:chromate transporter